MKLKGRVAGAMIAVLMTNQTVPALAAVDTIQLRPDDELVATDSDMDEAVEDNETEHEGSEVWGGLCR